MILQSKTVYVKRQWIECRHCGYGWNSETKITPETKKKRVCCSRCRSSITVYFSNEDDEDVTKPSTKLVKTVQELEEVQDPQKAVLNRKIEEFHRKSEENEMEMDKAIQQLLKKYPASSPEIDDHVKAESKERNAIWREKMKRMSYAQKLVFMTSELRKSYDALKSGFSKEQMKHFERRLAIEEKFADLVKRIELDEQMKAEENDKKYFKDLKRSKIKVKKRKVRKGNAEPSNPLANQIPDQGTKRSAILNKEDQFHAKKG